MEPINQDLFTNFAYGTVSATLTIEGEGAENRPEMLANIFSYVSKGVYKELIPRLSGVITGKELSPGETEVNEQVKVELFGYTVTLDVEVRLNVELNSPEKEALSFIVVGMVGPEVAEDIVGRISSRLKAEVIRDYYEQHPEEASPFGGGLGALLRDADIQVVAMGGPIGFPPEDPDAIRH